MNYPEARERAKREEMLADAARSLRAQGSVDRREHFQGEASLLTAGAAMTHAPDDSYGRTLIELRRDQLRRQADDLQRLLDALPAKLPEDAGQALLRLIG